MNTFSIKTLMHRPAVFVAAFLVGLGQSPASADDLRVGLVSYWPLDTVTAGTTPDLAYGNTLTVNNSPTLAAGQFGNALTFASSSSQYLGLTHSTDFNVNGLPIYNSPGGYTVAFWVKAASQSDKPIFAEANTNASNPLFQLTTSTTKLKMMIRTSGGTLVCSKLSTATVLDNTWHHVAWVDNLGAATLYVDGVVDTNFTYTAGGLTLNTTAVGALLRTAGASYFTGSVDDVALWQRPLSQVEVNQVRTNSFLPPPAQFAVSPPSFPGSNTLRLFLNGTDSTNSYIIFSRPDLSVSSNWQGNATGAVGQTVFDLPRSTNPTAFFRAGVMPLHLYGPNMADSFEYVGTAALLQEWPQAVGSDIALTEAITHSGSKALLAPDTQASDFIAHNFFPLDQKSVDVTVWFYHDIAAGYDTENMLVECFSQDGTYILLSTANSLLKYRLNSGTWTNTSQLVLTGWNQIEVAYDTLGQASVYLNGSLVTIFPEAKGFCTLALGKNWTTASRRAVVFDDVSVVSTAQPSSLDCAFEYASQADLSNHWAVAGTVSLAAAIKRSMNRSIMIPPGATGWLAVTNFPGDTNGVNLSIWFYQDPVIQNGYAYLMPRSVNGSYVIIRAGYYPGEPGNRGVAYRLGTDTWHNASLPVPNGWNELKVTYSTNGLAKLYFNDNYLGQLATPGYNNVEFGKSWDGSGTVFLDDFRCQTGLSEVFADRFDYTNQSALAGVWTIPTGHMSLSSSTSRSLTNALRGDNGYGASATLNSACWLSNVHNAEVSAKLFLSASNGTAIVRPTSWNGSQVALKADYGNVYAQLGAGDWQLLPGANVFEGWNEATFRWNERDGVSLLFNNSPLGNLRSPGLASLEIARDASGPAGDVFIDDISIFVGSQGTWIRGQVLGDDGKTVSAMVGVDCRDTATDTHVDLNGNPDTNGYSAQISLNQFYPCRPTIAGMNVGDTYPCLRPDLHRVKTHCETRDFLLGPLNIPAGHTWKVYFEVYPRNSSGTTDFTYYTGGLFQNLQVTSAGVMGLHITLQPNNSNTVATITGRFMKDGSPWAGKSVRFWGGPSGSDTGFNASVSTDDNGYFTATPLKTFWCELSGVRHASGCSYNTQVENGDRNYVVGSLFVGPGQTLNIGTIDVP